MYWLYLSSSNGWWGWCAFIGWQRELSIFISLFCTCNYNKNCLDYILYTKFYMFYVCFFLLFYFQEKLFIFFFLLLLLFHVTCFSFQHYFEIFPIIFMKSTRTTNVYPIPSGWRNTLKMQCCFGWRYSLSLGLLVCYYYCYVRWWWRQQQH